jgi:hypothetical protein
MSTIVTERRSVRIRSATRSRSWAASPASGSSSSRLGVRRERDRDLEQPLVAVREGVRDLEGAVAEPDGVQEPQRLGVQVRVAAGVREHREAAAVLRLRRDAHVLEGRERVEDADDLERTRDARRHDRVRGKVRDRGGAEPRPAAVGGEEGGEDVEERRLAGAVRPDDRAELAARDRERHAVDRRERAEVLGQILDLEQDLPGRRREARCRRGRGGPGRPRRDARAGAVQAAGAAQTLDDPHDPVGGEHDEGDEDHAEVDEPVLGPRRERVAHEDEDRRAHGGADEAPHAAHERHRDDLAGHRDVERLRVGEVEQERVEGAGEPAEGARDDERGELVALDVVADEARPRLVLADRLEDPPEGRVDDAPEEGDGADGEDGGRVVVDAFVAEVEAEGARGERKALDPAEAVFAPRHRRRPVDDVEEHLCERERQEREVDAPLAHQKKSDPRPGERGAEDAGDQRDPHALDQVELGESRGVPAEAEKGRVAEGDEPRVAHQEVVGDGEKAEDHDLGGERHSRLDRAHEERQHQEPHGEPRQRVAQDPRGAAGHSNFSQRSPMRPRGRSRRMTAMRMYMDASAARGWK